MCVSAANGLVKNQHVPLEKRRYPVALQKRDGGAVAQHVDGGLLKTTLTGSE